MFSASGRDALVALSLANLCYLRVWTELLTYRRADMYLMKLPPGPTAMVAAMANVLLAGGLFWLVARLVKRSRSERMRGFAQIVFLLFLAVPLNALRSVLSRAFPYFKSPLFEILGTRGVLLLVSALALTGCAAVLLFHRRLAMIAAAVLAVFSPFCAVTFGQAIWKASSYDASEFAPRSPAPLLAVLPDQRRVVWILFDEWDYRLTFLDPDPSLHLAEIARLRGETLFAGQTLPPGPETPISIPAYFTGRLVDEVQYDGPRELQVRFQSAPYGRTAGFEPWSAQPNVFLRARQLGVNTAAVEWFHPTCRILSGLSSCEFWPMSLQSNSMGDTFSQVVPGQTRSFFETSLFSPFGQSLAVQAHVDTYRAMLASALDAITNPQYGLTFIHMPIPHPPHGYNRRSGRFDLANSPIGGYVDSLALVDRTVGEIRRAMERAGCWDRTTVLFTSDHPYREAQLLDGKADSRIPFLLKLAGQQRGAVYSRPFNAVVTGDLLLAILAGEVGDVPSVVRWLEDEARRPLYLGDVRESHPL